MFVVDPRLKQKVDAQRDPSNQYQPAIEPSGEPDRNIPSYQAKKFFETGTLDDLTGRAASRVGGDLTIAQLRAGRTKSDPGPYTAAVDDLLGRGLGSLTPNQIAQRGKTDPLFLQQYGLGKAFSYQDLAQEALQGDPNFDPEDTQSIIGFAQELEKRGLNNTQRDKIASLATSQSVKNQIDRTVNPGNYLNTDQKAANAATAQRLLKQAYGDDYSDPDLQDFISERLAGGESAFELSQFLQTTPQFQEKKAAQENERVKTESAAAREALNEELLKSQQEVFSRAQPSIIASYMRAGRLNSSGLNSAIIKAQKELESERQGFLANAGYNDSIRAQGYNRENFVNNNAQAFNSYMRQNEPAYQQRFAVNNASNYANFQQPYNNLARQYQLSDEARQRQYELEDYDRQQSDYNRYLSESRKQGRESALYGLLGAGISGGIQGWAMRK